jgi:hypothetical protein
MKVPLLSVLKCVLIHKQIFDTELEKVPDFGGFTDFCRSFPLYRGKRTFDVNDERNRYAGSFKVSHPFVQY